MFVYEVVAKQCLFAQNLKCQVLTNTAIQTHERKTTMSEENLFRKWKLKWLGRFCGGFRGFC